MSLVVLKRKSQTKYSKISSQGSGRFSLNNPRRVESKSGRGRVQTQTPMKGNVPRGHGGCQTSFPIQQQLLCWPQENRRGLPSARPRRGRGGGVMWLQRSQR